VDMFPTRVWWEEWGQEGGIDEIACEPALWILSTCINYISQLLLQIIALLCFVF
jgi:hypothetical protein